MTTTTHDPLAKFLAAPDHPGRVITSITDPSPSELEVFIGRLSAALLEKHEEKNGVVFVALDREGFKHLIDVYREAQDNGVELYQILDPIRDLFGMDDLP